MRDHDHLNVSRRELLQYGAVSFASLSGISGLLAQVVEEGSGVPPALNRYPRMMQDYLGAKIVASQKIGEARRAAIQSRSDAEAYVLLVRELIRDCFGPFPERTPLNPRTMGIVERETYRIEKVIFESRPGFLVTANLYVPKGHTGKMPGVVASCGHSHNGKAAEPYQAFSQNLARLGYVTLIFDPIGQGERFQYPDEALKSKLGAGVHEHLSLGNQQFLVGDFLGTWRAWDAVRALDYLLTRPEVDPQHLGITGNSGGGTMTTWLCGLESRWTMAAPSCFVTTFRRNFENELPADTEQCPPKVLLHGLDHSDFLAAMAPKPVIIIAAEQDYFDVRGSIEAYQRLRRLYGFLGAEENVRLFIGPNSHGYTQPNREAMYEFFNAQTGMKTSPVEPALTIEKDETLWCTPRGQVADLNSFTAMTFTAVRAREFTMQRGELDAKTVQNRIQTLVPPRPTDPPDFQILRPAGKRRYPKPQATWYAIETERGIRAVVTRLADTPLISRPPRQSRRAILYVSHHSVDAELRHEPFAKQLLSDEPASEFYALDVRGIGDSQPQTCGEDQFLTPYGSDYFYAIHSLMLGLPYPIQRAFDILRVIDWLKDLGRTEIHLAAFGWGTIPATLAAVIAPEVRQVTLKNPLTSFTDIATADTYDWPLSTFLPNILSQVDLPDCYRALCDKHLTQIEPRGAAHRI